MQEKEMPRFSVIIPLYNKAEYVEKTLRSVFNQTFQDFELIIFDDGSTDNSYSVAENVLAQTNDVNFRLIHQQNAGVSCARNNGVDVSHGDYVCFLDADDWWTPTFLEEINNLTFDFPDAGIYGSGYYIVKNNMNRIAPIALDKDFERGYFDYVKVYSRYLCMPLTSISVAIPRSVFNDMKGFKPQLKLGEDFDLWLRIAIKYGAAIVNKQLAYYNQDVNVKNRAVGNLHKPETMEYVLYDEYMSLCPQNEDLKLLLDKKREYGLLPYYLDKSYRKWAKEELNKVNWSCMPHSSYIQYYKTPIFLLKMKNIVLVVGSWVKRKLIMRITTRLTKIR